MPESQEHGVVARAALAEAELAAIRALADACMRAEEIDLRIAWSELQSHAGEIECDILCYQDGALVGFLTLDSLGSDEAEATGMVDPAFRRRGVFSALLAAARDSCRRKGTPALLLVCDRRSASAKGFLAAAGAEYAMSEQKMRLDAPVAAPPSDDGLAVHLAAGEDISALAEILADDSDMDAADLRPAIAYGMQSGARRYYIGRMKGEAVGSLNVQVIDGDAYIYGFVVRPTDRGRGYGRQILARTVAAIVAERPQPVFLEVETNNAVALALYQSLGFTTTHVYDYYRMKT